MCSSRPPIPWPHQLKPVAVGVHKLFHDERSNFFDDKLGQTRNIFELVLIPQLRVYRKASVGFFEERYKASPFPHTKADTTLALYNFKIENNWHGGIMIAGPVAPNFRHDFESQARAKGYISSTINIEILFQLLLFTG